MSVQLDFVVPPAPDIRARMRALNETGLEYLAEDMKVEAQKRWRVDTGRSRRGLFTKVRGRTIQFWDRRSYAIWVERRWGLATNRSGRNSRQPGPRLQAFFSPARMRRLLSEVEKSLVQDVKDQDREYRRGLPHRPSLRSPNERLRLYPNTQLTLDGASGLSAVFAAAAGFPTDGESAIAASVALFMASINRGYDPDDDGFGDNF